jgi:hypothetical protein
MIGTLPQVIQGQLEAAQAEVQSLNKQVEGQAQLLNTIHVAAGHHGYADMRAHCMSACEHRSRGPSDTKN